MTRVTAFGGNFFKARADRTEESAYDKFTRVNDLKCRRPELCQPPAGRFPG